MQKINTITSIQELNTWVTIAQVEANKHYQIKYTPTAFTTQVDVHLHEADSKHISTLSIPGTASLANFPYRYEIWPRVTGYIAMRINAGELYNIEVSEL